MSLSDNARLLERISEYLAFTPCAIRPADVAARTDLPPDVAYLSLLAGHLGLDAPDVLRGVVQRHDPAGYEADAYFRTVRPIPGAASAIDLAAETIEPMELFIADDIQPDGQGCMLPRLGWFDRVFSYPAIREDGRVWMTVTPNEINTIQPAVRQSCGKVLTYGLGLGYYAFHCLLKEDVHSVTVVERSPEVIRLFRQRLLPFFPRQHDLHIVQADAFDYAAHVMPQEGFDTVFTDLWRDVADGIPLYQRMKALETPGPRYLYWMEKTLQACMD